MVGKWVMGLELRDGPDEKNGTNAVYEGIRRWPACQPKCGLFFKENVFEENFEQFLHAPRPKIDMKGVKFGAGDYVVLKDDRKGIVQFFGRDPRYPWYEPLIGIVLLPKYKPDDKIGTDGVWHAKRYFTCEPGRGIFITIDNWTKVFGKFEEPEKTDKDTFIQKRRERITSKFKNYEKVRKEKYEKYCKNWKVGDWILFGDRSKGKIVKIEQKGTIWIIYFERSDGRKFVVNDKDFDKKFGGIVKNETSEEVKPTKDQVDDDGVDMEFKMEEGEEVAVSQKPQTGLFFLFFFGEYHFARDFCLFRT